MACYSPLSVQSTTKGKTAQDSKEDPVYMTAENGRPAMAADEAGIRKSENPYAKYFGQQGEHQLVSDAQA